MLPAFAKINLDLRILGIRRDGYHDLRTIFQTLALNDTLTFTARKGAFRIQCDDPDVPTDRRNLVWQAASLLWRTAGKRRGNTPRDAVVQLQKRIPVQAGLGGGSANAAIALLGLARVWELDVDLPTISRLAAGIGADVPFFLLGERRSASAAATISTRSPIYRVLPPSSCGRDSAFRRRRPISGTTRNRAPGSDRPAAAHCPRRGRSGRGTWATTSKRRSRPTTRPSGASNRRSSKPAPFTRRCPVLARRYLACSSDMTRPIAPPATLRVRAGMSSRLER